MISLYRMSLTHSDVELTTWWVDLLSWLLNKLSHWVLCSVLHRLCMSQIMILSYILNWDSDCNISSLNMIIILLKNAYLSIQQDVYQTVKKYWFC